MMRILLHVLILTVFSSLITLAQHQTGTWVYKSSTDTTIVGCWNDSASQVSFPPGTMNGMMFPDSIFCWLEKLHLDSLTHVHDSTYMGWYRFQIGTDSMHFDMMNDSMTGGNHMMQFMSDLICTLHWDSLMTDSVHIDWHPTGVHGWNGSAWIPMSGVTFGEGVATFTISRLYSAYAFVGSPGGIVGVDDSDPVIGTFRLNQNYPNPFNPVTSISYALPASAYVRLSVFNILGQEVGVVVEEAQEAGYKTVSFDATNLPTGLYTYRLTAGTFTDVKKMLLLK